MLSRTRAMQCDTILKKLVGTQTCRQPNEKDQTDQKDQTKTTPFCGAIVNIHNSCSLIFLFAPWLFA